MSTVTIAWWGRWKYKYHTDNGYRKKFSEGWVASGGFAQANVRACVCLQVGVGDVTAGHQREATVRTAVVISLGIYLSMVGYILSGSSVVILAFLVSS